MNAREISGIVFGRAREGILVALRVYFDGAGKDDCHPVITVGGFLAPADVAEQIESDWEIATDKKVFHFTDFNTPSCKLGSQNWTSQERIQFLKKLAAIVNRQEVYILSASIEVQEFDKVLSGAAHPHELGPAFSGCAYVALLNLEALLKDEGRRKNAVHYVYEKGDREHEIRKVFADFDNQNSELQDLRKHQFLPKKTTLLQPADLIAGVVQRCVMNSYAALPCLDNGHARGRLSNFEKHYSGDGVTAAVLAGHDRDKACKCWIVNAKSFSLLDKIGKDFFDKHPDRLKKSLKSNPYKPKMKQ
ncbi:hypothetical protein [Edaphobacter sp.]|uniref:hypothetical protein n=1 Tax=Edaphobacter sp. TaxID=1934404 RepID=UPI002DB99FAB|nr:hypothetical protein [Edaphobacter sp.]HEU5339770.1 hypothetical protein [Edaphobacter sp.]